jgi:restriction modification system DNA specificity domain protein
MDRTIGECFYQIQNGANIKQGNANGGYPITRIETIANDKFNRDRMGYAGINDISKYESYILEDGDLLMSHINSVQYLGRTVLYEKIEEETIIHGMNLLRLRARSDIINPSYARYCFYGHLFRSQIANITKKSVNQASFAIQDLKQIKIDVPEVRLQKQIVEILNKISWIIEKRKQELDTFDELIRARFVEMFGDLVVNPYKWTVVKLSDISLFLKSGLSRRLSDVDIGLPVIRSGNIQNGQFVYNDIKYWYKDDPQGANTEDYRLENGDILVNFINSASQIGKTAIFSGVNRECIYTTNILRMKLTDSCNIYYYNWFAMSDYYYMQLRNIIQPAVNQASFTTVNFLKLNILLPPLQLQNQFETFVHQVNKSKFIVKNHIVV